MSDPYEGLAERYDLFFERFGDHSPAEEAFFRRLFVERGVTSVLDCACGTGHDLVLFRELGCRVVGSDLSEAMLARAQRNLAGRGVHVPLHQADYRDLPSRFVERFDAVTCLSSSILHMPDEGEALRAYQSMRGVLREGGILVLTQGTTDRQWAEQPRFMLAANSPEFTRCFAIDYREQEATYNILDIWHGAERSELAVWSCVYPRLLRDDHERLLREAGFADLAFYGHWDGSPYEKAASRRLIIVAER